MFSPDVRRKNAFSIEMSEIRPGAVRQIQDYDDVDQPSPFLDFNL
jgi:hypothetical protein